ncbi:hypothetical protein QOT17_007803 [Balamuthia mandrillaris]
MSIQQVPSEVLQLVFELLPPKQVATSCGLVCQSWQNASQDPAFWYRCFEKWWNERVVAKEEPQQEEGEETAAPPCPSSSLFPQLLSEAGISLEKGLHYEPSAPWKKAFLQTFYMKHISINEKAHKDRDHYGLAFDIIAHADVTLTRLSFFTKTYWSQPLRVQVYYHPEGLQRHESSEKGWVPVFEKPVSFSSERGTECLTFPQPLNIKLANGSTTALYIHTSCTRGISYIETNPKNKVGDVVLAGPHLSLCAGFYYPSSQAFDGPATDQIREFAGRMEYFTG